MWDAHVRVGDFTGSNLQYTQCPANSASGTPVNINCIAAYMSMHVTLAATGLYMENVSQFELYDLVLTLVHFAKWNTQVWIWTADHDIDDPGQRQITIHNGRGFYVEGGAGVLWL
jgi:glucan 1,3-beta-glucosidase